MRVVIQHVSQASVTINGTVKSSIGKGFLILLGVESEDTQEDANWLADKITQLRIFEDNDGKMNLNLQDANGQLMVISQFTLFASTKKGNRPSFIRSAKAEVAIPLYEYFIQKLSTNTGNEIATGEFGADMKVSLLNDGPVTILIDSKQRE